jgi:hypothetical protein
MVDSNKVHFKKSIVAICSRLNDNFTPLIRPTVTSC